MSQFTRLCSPSEKLHTSLNTQSWDCLFGGRCENRVQPIDAHGSGLTPGPLSFSWRYMRPPTRSIKPSCRLAKDPSGTLFWTRSEALSDCFFCGFSDAAANTGNGRRPAEFVTRYFMTPVFELRFKAAEDSRTPRRWRVLLCAAKSARSWSAAVLCRFFDRSAMCERLLR
jgi:hypothetical protein